MSADVDAVRDAIRCLRDERVVVGNGSEGDEVVKAHAALDRLAAAEAQRDTLNEAVAGIERLRDEAIKNYGDCREEGSRAEAAMWDARAASYSRALGLLDRAALAAVAPAEAKP